MLDERYPASISTYPKPIDPELVAAIAKFEEEVGVTDLDDPSAPKRKTPRTDAQLRILAGIEHKRAKERAQLENQAALARLKDGTAVLRQKSERTKPAKKTAKTVKAAKEIAKLATKPAKATESVKPAVKKARKPYYHTPNRAVPSLQLQAKARRKVMLDELSAGKFLPVQPKQSKKGEFDLYQQQRTAIKKLEKEEGLTVVRIRCLKSGQSFWALDNFKRHQIERKVSGRLDGADRKDLIKAVASKELVLASDLTDGTRTGVSSARLLTCNHGMNIYTVFTGKYVLGWILLDEADQDGATISEVLAVKDAQ